MTSSTVSTKEMLKKVRQIEIRTNRLVDATLTGQYHSVFKGRGMNFEEVREYIPGDEVRTIDWNVTARTGRPFVKKFTEERELTIFLIIDVSASGHFGSKTATKREIAAEIGSVLAFSAVRNNDKVGLLLFSDRIEHFVPPAKGRSHILRVIRDILFFEPKGLGTDIPAALHYLNEVQRRKAVAFLITDFCFPKNFQNELELLRPILRTTGKRHDLISIAVTDPREEELPPVGLLVFEDMETGEQIEIQTSNPFFRKRYTQLIRDNKDQLRHTVRSSGVDLLEISTEKPYLPTLMNFFSSRQKRR